MIREGVKDEVLPMSAVADRPLRLHVAAEKYFDPPEESGVHGRTLKRMPDQGKLRIYRVAGKDFTTLADIDEAVRNSAMTAPADDGRAAERCEAAIEVLRKG